MFIQEVIIEGFKSYAQRTVIQGWDPQFNAITGLNGSGKSNILDAICFVLGITNLSQVRAGNLQDLVYKQGQAGVTKASVTIVFNNADAAGSPIGYEHHETISVCRQVSSREKKEDATTVVWDQTLGFGERRAPPALSGRVRTHACAE
jgi:structural maintenance of chromosome 2